MTTRRQGHDSKGLNPFAKPAAPGKAEREPPLQTEEDKPGQQEVYLCDEP